MQTFAALDWVQRIRKHRNPLLVAGEGCSRISLDGEPLVAYAAVLAEVLSCPVAATGNTLRALREQGKKVRAKKMWLAELFRYLEGDWQEPILQQRPDLLLLIGYRPEMVQGMAAGVQGVSIAHLGPGTLPGSDLTMEAVPIAEWKRRLDELVAAFR